MSGFAWWLYIYIYMLCQFSYFHTMIWWIWRKAEVLWHQGLLPPRWCWLQKWPRLGWNMSQDLTFSTFNHEKTQFVEIWNIYFFCWVFIFGVLKIIYHHIIMFVWKFANIAAKPVAIKQWFCKTFWNPWTDFGCGASFCKVPTDSVRFGEVRWDLKERNREV